MKVVFLTGSHPRHAFMARSLQAAGVLVGLVIEQRESFIPEPPLDIPLETRSLFRKHFAARDDAERRFFGGTVLPKAAQRDVTIDALNTPETVAFINDLKPDLVLSYGVHKLTPETLNGISCPRKWNIHGGLSPWYRGVTTHFWPSYFLEPQMTGMTMHETTEAIDGGAVVHQSVAGLVRGDGLHDLACRAVTALGQEMPQLMRVVSDGNTRAPHKQGTTGRIWRSVDWRPEHLHLIYEVYGDRIVDHYLDGRFGHTEPKLTRQF